MPVHGESIDVRRVLLLNFTEESQKQNSDQTYDANSDVKGVKTYKGVVRGAKEIGTDRETLVVDKMMPFAAGCNEKNRTEEQGEEPPEAERTIAGLA